GTSIDVIEMDAASNRSVDDIRDLRERVAYAPAGGGWKVYILDEAHMLTNEAWNAFLKTLEEPPPNTVFVLATTEAHRVMPTIADRCQRFDFQRPSLEQISEVLERVAAAEGIEIEEGAVAMIARSASGSFREALGTLDQLVAFGGEKVGLDAVLELLGAADAELLFGAVDAVAAEDPRGVLVEVEKMARSGRDPAQFARDLLGHLRHLLVTQTVGEVPNTFVVTATDANRLAAQSDAVGAAALVRTIDELAAALTAVREGDDARMAVEIALLKAARPDLDPSTEGLLRRIERLEQATGSSAPRPAGPVTGDDSSSSRDDAAGEEPPPAPPAGAAPADDRPAQPAPPSPAASAAGGGGGGGARTPPPADPPSSGDRTRGPQAPGLSLEEIQRVWPAVLDHLLKSAPALAATFEGARPVGLDEEGLRIGFPGNATFNKRKAEAPDKRDQLLEALDSVTGRRVQLHYVLLDGAEGEAEAEPAAGEEVDHEALVERLKSEFDAEEVG
ncbi:MAG TPA: DNA polymerase III subunit gamma/tau, partial [Solirubrobacterales bacterium]